MRVLIDGNVHDPLSPAEEQDVRQFRAEESVQGSVLSADEATKARVGQAKRVADRDDRRPDTGGSAEGRGDDDLGQLRRSEHGDVHLLVRRGDGRARHRAIGEGHGDAPAARDHVVRGQYGGYRDEEGVAYDSETETFIALKVGVDNWRWAAVPFYLRTGKRMAEGMRIISIAFKEAPRSMFPPGSGAYDSA